MSIIKILKMKNNWKITAVFRHEIILTYTMYITAEFIKFKQNKQYRFVKTGYSKSNWKANVAQIIKILRTKSLDFSLSLQCFNHI